MSNRRIVVVHRRRDDTFDKGVRVIGLVFALAMIVIAVTALLRVASLSGAF